RGDYNVALEGEFFRSGHAIRDEQPGDEDEEHADAGTDSCAHGRIVSGVTQFVLKMRFLTAHERWATTRSKLNPGLRRMLRDVGGYLRGGGALVTREVDGGHAIPIPMAERHRSITIRGREQQILREKRAPLAFDLTTVNTVSGEVLRSI